jgi:hypothetical protein
VSAGNHRNPKDWWKKRPKVEKHKKKGGQQKREMSNKEGRRRNIREWHIEYRCSRSQHEEENKLEIFP